MRCPWCANPEGIAVKPPLLQMSAPLPEALCPYGAIQSGALDRNRCHTCIDQRCVNDAPNPYLQCRAVRKSVEEWMAEIHRAAPMFFSGGGLTLTGGEVGVQWLAARELLMLCQESGIHTAVETNLTRKEMPELFPSISLLIADYKHYDSGKLETICGVGKRNIERNLKIALGMGLPIWLRIPLIGGFNSDPADVAGFVEALSPFRDLDAGTQLAIEFLPYHEYGAQKWKQCGLSYAMVDGFVSEKTKKVFQAEFQRAGFRVMTT